MISIKVTKHSVYYNTHTATLVYCNLLYNICLSQDGDASTVAPPEVYSHCWELLLT